MNACGDQAGRGPGPGRHTRAEEALCELCAAYQRGYNAGWRKKTRPSRSVLPCGTPGDAGAQRHVAHGEPICAACLEARREYRRQLRRREKESRLEGGTE